MRQRGSSDRVVGIEATSVGIVETGMENGPGGEGGYWSGHRVVMTRV